MHISKKEILNMAELAYLHLSDDEAEKIGLYITQLLSSFKEFTELDSEGLEVMAYALDLKNVLREDLPGEHFNQREVFLNTEESEDNCFLIPKVVG